MSLVGGIIQAFGAADSVLDSFLGQAGLPTPAGFPGDFNDFSARIQKASFRGVPFGVVLGESKFGRRVVVHDYPFRDTQWAEDLGAPSRKFSIQGFLLTGSLLYDAGDVVDQRERLVGAVLQSNAGTLIHPTFGRLQVSIPEDGLVVTERLDGATFMEFTLACVETGERQFPSDSTDSSDGAADSMDDGAGLDFGDDVASAFGFGQFVVNMGVSTAAQWVGLLNNAAQDATGIFNLAASLPGDYGRFFNGALSGYATSFLGSAEPLTVENLIFAAAQHRDAVRVAGDALVAASKEADPPTIAAAAQAAGAALQACVVNPADGVRLFLGLANFYPAEPTGPSVIGQSSGVVQNAMGALLRRTSLACLVRMTQTYAPQSADDANQVRTQVCDALDAEAVVAGDGGDDASFKALSSARGAVAVDLDSRGGSLPPMRTFTFNQALPALTLAYRLYQDSGRADELIRLANARNPVFMPLSFKALSS